MYAYMGKSWSMFVLPASGTDDHLEAAEDHPLAVEGHEAHVLLHARVLHRLLHPRVARRLRRPGDPREHHRLVVVALHGHGEGRDLALGYVVAPALDDGQGAMRLEHAGRGLCDAAVVVLLGGGNGNDEAIDVVHGNFLSSPEDGGMPPCIWT